MFLRPGPQISGTAAGIPLQRRGPEESDQERAAAACQPQFLRELSEHDRQQDDGGQPGYCEDVRDGPD